MSEPITQSIDCSPPCVGEPSAPARWFKDNVHAHEPQLKSYLRGSFPAVRDVDDVVQESYLRIWKRHAAKPVASAKAFLFQIARHLAIDAIRRRRTAATDSLGDMSAIPVIEEKAGASEKLCYDEKVELLAAALLSLPPRCREIMTLRKLQNLGNREIAARMGISVRTVENQITRGTQLCQHFLRAHGIDSFSRE